MKIRFSIRDLLWLTLVVALVVGWKLDFERMHRIQTELRLDEETSHAAADRLSVELFELKQQKQSASINLLAQYALDIFDGKITPDANGICEIDPKSNVCENHAYVTKRPDGSIFILFRTWQGKGSNLRGYLFTDGLPLTVGSEVEVLTFAPLGRAGRVPVGKATVLIDSAISPKCYAVSRSSD